MNKLKKLHLLFLEDNQEFAKNTIDTLELYFKTVNHCTTISSALATYNDQKIDVMISDIKLEAENGLDFIQEIRKVDSTTPIVVLSAHKDTDFLLQAIPLNILSYELKPLSYSGLMRLLEKISKQFNPDKLTYLSEGIQFSYKDKVLIENGESICLTKKEVLFIELLLKYKDSIVSPQMIQRDVYEDKEMGEGSIKNLIFRLRKKTVENFIVTVTNLGYKLSSQLES